MKISTAQKIGLGLVGLLAVVGIAKAATTKSQTDNIANKFLFDFGSFRIHEIGWSKIVFAVDGIKVYNQSSISANISNLYVNIKNKNSAGSLEQLFTQENYINSLDIPANATSTLPSMYFSIPITSLTTLWDMFNKKISQILYVNVRFQVLGGYEISMDNEVNLASQMSMLSALWNNAIVKIFFGNRNRETTGTNSGANSSTNSSTNSGTNSGANQSAGSGSTPNAGVVTNPSSNAGNQRQNAQVVNMGSAFRV
jgi:hypothetical protein